MFRTPCAHNQEVKIVLNSLWYHHNYRCYDTNTTITTTTTTTTNTIYIDKFTTSTNSSI